MRTMVTAVRTEHCIAFRTLAKDEKQFRYNNRSPNFYVLKEDISRAIQSGREIIIEDCSNYCKIYCVNNVIKLTFTWLKRAVGSHPHLAWHEAVEIKLRPFKAWITSEGPSAYKTLDQSTRTNPNKFIFSESAQPVLRNIVAEPVIKRKFVKALLSGYMNDPTGSTFIFTGDHNDYSFFWREKLLNNKNGICGGLIFHHDHEEPGNLAKARYSIHT